MTTFFNNEIDQIRQSTTKGWWQSRVLCPKPLFVSRVYHTIYNKIVYEFDDRWTNIYNIHTHRALEIGTFPSPEEEISFFLPSFLSIMKIEEKKNPKRKVHGRQYSTVQSVDKKLDVMVLRSYIIYKRVGFFSLSISLFFFSNGQAKNSVFS